MRPAVRRTVLTITVAALAGGAWVCLHAGTLLVREDSLRRADAIFVLAGTRFERAMEAADLFRAGYAPTVLLSPGIEEPSERVLRAKGIHFPREAEPVREALAGLGVPRDAILIGDGSVDSTASEAALLKEAAARYGWHTVIVVTSKYHSRRAGFAIRRTLAGTGVTLLVRASRYDPSDPAHWWRRRADVRWLMVEWPKQIVYRLGLSN